MTGASREGASFLGLSVAAEKLGFRTLAARVSHLALDEVPTPFIAHWKEGHFVVVHKVRGDHIHVADPALGPVLYRRGEFLQDWAQHGRGADRAGLVLALEPTPEFHRPDGDAPPDRTGWGVLLPYMWQYRSFLLQLLVGLLAGTALSLVAPLLTQALVDFGIDNQDLGFVYVVLIAQLMVFAGRASMEFLRSWILRHLGLRVNIALISDFLIKLLTLPLPFFERRLTGDIVERIRDHVRLESFLGASTLNVLFAVVTTTVYGAVLLLYDPLLFLVFVLGTALAVAWAVGFMRRRRELDGRRFAEMSDEQNHILELLQGIQEIKLNDIGRQKRWQWEHIQARRFRTTLQGLAISQYQEGGLQALNETKNILITVLAAAAVIQGDMTLGMMMAALQIVGQLNAPVGQFITFLQTVQDAKLTLERLGEVQDVESEEAADAERLPLPKALVPITVDDVSFRYGGADSPWVLRGLSLEIAPGSVTAIVGSSGSGKTTLVKTLLGFYDPTEGQISLGARPLRSYGVGAWRRACGVVMQDGYVFNDTIARNIALDFDSLDRQRLADAARIARIADFVESLPLGYNTVVGIDGQGLSEGQRQRLLIARAVYKDPAYLFFDEATSSLDATNEREIMEALEAFRLGRTVVVVAHRLSTVLRADRIVVLEDGRIVESGSHAELVDARGRYFDLVRNQLELGR